MDKTSINLKLDLTKLIQESAGGPMAPRIEAPKKERQALAAAPPSRAIKPSKAKPMQRVLVPATQVQYRLDETSGLRHKEKKLAGKQLHSNTPRDNDKRQGQPFRELENNITKFAHRSDFSFDFQTEAKLSKSQPLEAGLALFAEKGKGQEIGDAISTNHVAIHADSEVALTKLLKDQNLGSRHVLVVEDEEAEARSSPPEEREGRERRGITALSMPPMGPQELDPAVLGTFNDSPVVMGQGRVRGHGRALVFKSFTGNTKRAAPTSEFKFGGSGHVTETMKEDKNSSALSTTDMNKQEPSMAYINEDPLPEKQPRGKPSAEVMRTQFQLVREEPKVSPTSLGFKGHKLRAVNGVPGQVVASSYQSHSSAQSRVGPRGTSPGWRTQLAGTGGSHAPLSRGELGASVAVYKQYQMSSPVDSEQGPESPQRSGSPYASPSGKSSFFKAILNADRARDEELEQYMDIHMPEVEAAIISAVPGFTMDPPLAKVDNPHLNDKAGLEEVLKGTGSLSTDPEIGTKQDTLVSADKRDDEGGFVEAKTEGREGGEPRQLASAGAPRSVPTQIEVAMPSVLYKDNESRPTCPLNHSTNMSKIQSVQRSIVRCVATHRAEVAITDALIGLSSVREHSEPSEAELSQLTEIERDHEYAKYPSRMRHFYGRKEAKMKTEFMTGACNHGYDDPAGNYQVKVGDHIHYRFEVQGLLGWGSFGAVYQCWDHGKKRDCAIKICRNKAAIKRQAVTEQETLLMLRNSAKSIFRADLVKQLTRGGGGSNRGSDPLIAEAKQLPDVGGAGEGQAHNIVTMLECFTFRAHPCFVFRSFGMNLYEYLKASQFQGLGLGQVRKVALQLLKALRHLKSLGIVHCDIKPENVLLKSGPRDGGAAQDEGGMEVVLCDFGSSCCVGATFPSYMQSRFYRAPEVVLRLRQEIENEEKQDEEKAVGLTEVFDVYATPAATTVTAAIADDLKSSFAYGHELDMWSLSAMLPELRTGNPCFPAESEPDLFACQCEVLGMPPKSLLERVNPEVLRGLVETADDGQACLLESLLVTPQGTSRKVGSRSIGSVARARKNDASFVDFLQSGLAWDPLERLDVEMALSHVWVQATAHHTHRRDNRKSPGNVEEG